MSFPFQKFPMSKILAFAIVCIAVQPSFLLPQDTVKQDFGTDKIIENISATVAGEEPQFSLRQTNDMPVSATHNDSASCFLYFVSQDVNSLLNQARRMLAVSTTDRQRSWLNLYLHNLESLSKKLRQLPAENKNRCFQIREKLESVTTDDKDLSSAPNEVQLRFAKKLFLASHQHPNAYRLRNGRPNEYVTGTISTGRSEDAKPFEGRVETPLVTNLMPSQDHNMAYIPHQQSNKYNENNSENLEPSRKVDVVPNVGSRTVPQSVSRPGQASTVFPITHRNQMNVALEAMPFIPRATRKITPHLEQKMRFRAFSSHARTTDAPREEKDDGTQTHNPLTLHLQTSTHLIETMGESTAANSVPSEERHPEVYQAPSTQQYEETFNRQLDHQMNPAAMMNKEFKVPHSEKSSEKTTEYFDNDDDLVVQLHSEGKYVATPNEKIHPRLMQNLRPLKPLPSVAASAPTSSPEVEMTKNELGSHEKPMEKNENVDADTITGTSSINDNLEAMPMQNENDLDFDYEEQGAAAGELFIDDDVIPTKYLTVAPSIENTASTDDEVVRQLEELKSLKVNTIPANNIIPQTEVAPAAVSTKQHNIGFSGVHRLLVNNK